MKKYTANYALTNPNFVIQNLVENEIESQEKGLLYVIKNILQRGFPTLMSKYLQGALGEVHKEDDFKTPFLFISPTPSVWTNTIKGDEDNQYFPAKDFLERVIPQEFGEFSFIQSLILPEVEINEIIGIENNNFINQQVDFYLPQAKLIIEIDGQQHKSNVVTRIGDIQRDNYLSANGYSVIRITTNELKNGRYKERIAQIIDHLQTDRIARNLTLYKDAYGLVSNNALSETIITKKIIPSAIIRFQLLLVDFLLHQYLSFHTDWKFNLIVNKDEHLGNFAELAIEDFFLWYGHIYKLKTKQDFIKPNYEITTYYSLEDFKSTAGVINVNFSLFERWTDENITNPDFIFVKTDYFGAEKNYFKVSCTNTIQYEIRKDDESILEFFLQNIYEKPSFRDGQFPIISSVLNGEDTVGLLPTGGGKSMCYQLPCLLQPSVSFVVCPIKSLMYDQQLNMKASYVTNTNSITSDLSAEEKKLVQNNFARGKYLFIWISPERFQIESFRNYIADVNTNLSISYAVIDEVHCMSEWGHDFRTSYLNLTKTIQRYCPKSTFIGLTATASVNVLKDIKFEFSRNDKRLRDDNVKAPLDYSRKELEFDIILDNNSKYAKLQEIIKNKEILEHETNACLIFTPHVNGSYGCYSLANSLNGLGQGKTRWYSGQVPEIPEIDMNGRKTGKKLSVMNDNDFKEYKKNVQASFKDSKFPVLVATKAFGMGIDKNNINYTVHYGIPGSVEALYQEAGRAGRWNDKSKKAKCYVLYSQETTNQEIVDKLFDINTSIAEIAAINEDVRWDSRDVFRQIFLFLQGQRDINEDFKVVKLILNNYYKPNSKQKIWFETVSRELRNIGFSGSNEQLKEVAQKGIYRLRLLGIVEDWTTDFVNHFDVEFKTNSENIVKESLRDFISKYQPDIDIEEKLDGIGRDSIIDKSIWYLLQWSFENIVYNRKQSLKTLAELCNNFEKNGSDNFKRTIDNYFRITDTTFIFQHISENPKDFKKWFEVFYVGKDLVKGKEGVYIPEIIDVKNRQEEFERLRDSLSRFLESNRNNIGLNLISGLVRLSLDDYDNSDGKSRFEKSLEYIKANFLETAQLKVLKNLKEYGQFLSEQNKESLCFSIIKYYPNQLEKLADYYGLFYLLDDTISKKVQQLKKLNQKLHEELEQIGTL